MGSRTWIKIYCDKWLNGTIREESLEVRAVWVDLLVLAGSGKYGDSGEIKITEQIGYSDLQLAELLQVSRQKWAVIKKRLIETDRIIIKNLNGDRGVMSKNLNAARGVIPKNSNIICIKNWSKYQSEYERTKPFRVTKSTTNSTALDRDKRLEIENRERERERDNPPDPPLSSPSTEQERRIHNAEALQSMRQSRQKTPEEAIEYYQDTVLLGGTVTEEMDKEIRAACVRYSPALVYQAINEAKRQDRPSWRYIMGILQNWSKEGK